MARASEGKALQEAAQAAGEGSEQEAPQAVDAMGLLASFDFNTEPLDGKFVSNDVTAAIVGTGAALQDRDEAHGKALYLDGSAQLPGSQEIRWQQPPDRPEGDYDFL